MTTINDDVGTACPVAAMATKAAALLRIVGVPKAKPIEFDDEKDSLPTQDYIRRLLLREFRAIEKMAVHARAISAKGALFQIYLAGTVAYSIPDMFDLLPKSEAIKCDADAATDDIWRLTRSAAAVLEAAHDDDDLRILRSWYLELEVSVDEVLAQLHAA